MPRTEKQAGASLVQGRADYILRAVGNSDRFRERLSQGQMQVLEGVTPPGHRGGIGKVGCRQVRWKGMGCA